MFNLGYFDEVNVNTEQGSDARPDRREHRASRSGRPGSSASARGTAASTASSRRSTSASGISSAGARRRSSGSASASQSRLGLVGFTEPYLFDIPLRAGFDIYDRVREYDDFTEERLGGDIRASYPLTEYLTALRPLPAGGGRHHGHLARRRART